MYALRLHYYLLFIIICLNKRAMDTFSSIPAKKSYNRSAVDDLMARLFGEEALSLLSADGVTEVYLNPGESVLRYDKHGFGRKKSRVPFPAARAEQFLNCVATRFDLDISEPQIHIKLPQVPFGGARLQGLLPPLVDFASFNIRRHGRVVKLEKYANDGIISEQQLGAITKLIAEKANIIIAGGTRSGKTTLAGAIIDTIDESERLVVLEDTAELIAERDDVVFMRTAAGTTLEQLVRWTLRISPDRIIVGEVRGPEALGLLDAWSTGHPGGVATVHAGDAEGALLRLERLAARASASSQRELVASAVDAVIVIEGQGNQRRVAEIATNVGIDALGHYSYTLL